MWVDLLGVPTRNVARLEELCERVPELNLECGFLSEDPRNMLKTLRPSPPASPR